MCSVVKTFSASRRIGRQGRQSNHTHRTSWCLWAHQLVVIQRTEKRISGFVWRLSLMLFGLCWWRLQGRASQSARKRGRGRLAWLRAWAPSVHIRRTRIPFRAQRVWSASQKARRVEKINTFDEIPLSCRRQCHCQSLLFLTLDWKYF